MVGDQVSVSVWLVTRLAGFEGDTLAVHIALLSPARLDRLKGADPMTAAFARVLALHRRANVTVVASAGKAFSYAAIQATGASAREHCAAKFSIDRVGDRTIEFYENIITRHHA